MTRFLAGLAVAAAASGAAIAQEVVFVGPGGSNQQAFLAKVLPIFTQQTGVQVRYVAATVLEALAKTEAQRQNPEYDVVVVTDDGYAAFRKKDLFERLTTDLVPRFGDIIPAVRYPDDFGVPIFIGVGGIAYNTAILAKRGIAPPTSVKALWDPVFSGRAAVWTPRTSTGILTLLAVAKAYGGDEGDMDRTFAKLKEIAPDLLFNRADEMTAMFQQEQIWIGWQNNVRVAQLQAQGFPIGMKPLDEGTPLFTNGVVLVKGARNRENGLKLINFLLSDVGQRLMAEALGSGPTVASVKLDADLAAKVPYGAAVKGGFLGDWDKIVANRAAWMDRWNKEIER